MPLWRRACLLIPKFQIYAGESRGDAPIGRHDFLSVRRPAIAQRDWQPFVRLILFRRRVDG